MSSDVQISFVIPVFNTEEYLPQCIESILSDRTVKTEIVVVDDCSSGNCHLITQNYPQVKYIRHSVNKSSYQARLTGIRESSGKYICFIDSDDYLSKTDFGTLYSQLEKEKADFAIFSARTESTDFTICDIDKCNGRDEIINSLCKGLFRWNLCDKIFRASTLKSTLCTDFDGAYMNLAEDFCLFACVCANSQKAIKARSKTEYFYRTNQESITNSSQLTIQTVDRHLRSYRQARLIVLKYYKKINIPLNLIEQIDKKFSWNIHWYYDNFIRNNNFDIEDKCLAIGWLLESFNKEDVIEYLISSDYCNFGRYLTRLPKSKRKVKRIAIVVSSLSGGGTERVSTCLADIFWKLGYFVHFITRVETTNTYRILSDISYSSIISASLKERLLGFNKIAKKYSIDTFLFVDYYLYQTMDEILAAKAEGYNVIAMEHNSFFVPFYVNEIGLFNKRLSAYKVADALTCLSPMDLEAWRNSGIGNVHFIENPIPPAFADEKQTRSRNLKQTEKRVIFAGRLVYQKGVDFIPQIMKLVLKKQPKVKFQICGVFSDSTTRSVFMEEVRKFGIENSVELKGFVRDMEGVFAEARVLFLPSRFEGLPMVLLEAKAYGVPAVIFEMPYLVGADPQNGCIQVPFGDCVAMADAICNVLGDDTFFAEMSAKAKNSLGIFSDDVIIPKWKSLFKSIEDCSGSPSDLDLTPSELVMKELHKSLTSFSPKEFNAVPELGLYGKLRKVMERVFPPFSIRRRILRQIAVYIIRIAERS